MENDENLVVDSVDESEAVKEQYVPEELSQPYELVNQLHIPNEARDAFAAKGFDLQWIRIYEPNNHGTLDLKNIQKKEADQYQLVPRNEIPGLGKSMSSYFGEQLEENSNGLYIVGDVALAKFPIKRKQAKRKFLQERTQKRNDSIMNDLRKDNLAPAASRGEEFKVVRSPNTRDVDFGE